jgi:hypothetical protein
MSFGFVYIWRDRKRKKFYLGSHLGEKNDGYTGSGLVFKRAFSKRPNDFKRRILEEGEFANRKELHKKEQAWLNLISEKELGVKYYNLKRVAEGGNTIEGYGYKEKARQAARSSSRVRKLIKDFSINEFQSVRIIRKLDKIEKRKKKKPGETWLGRKHDDMAKKKMSLAKRNKSWNKKRKEKYENSKKPNIKNIIPREETIRKIRENNGNRIGSIHTPYGIFNSINDFVKNKGMISDVGLKNFLKGENRPISEIRSRNNPLLSKKDIGKTPKELGWYFLEKKIKVKDNELKRKKIHTPFGIFETISQFIEKKDLKVNDTRLRDIIIRECDKPISKSRAIKHPLFNKDNIGKTPRELGYYLIGE